MSGLTGTYNAPAHAKVIPYCYGKKLKGMMYVWQGALGPNWYWSAAGNNGMASSFNQAVDNAREWILTERDRSTENN